jgi:hypothetical protein
MLERENEKGAGGSYQFSGDREVCPGEVGLGLDLGVGLYAGFCFDAMLDFLGGIFFLDPDDDDIR